MMKIITIANITRNKSSISQFSSFSHLQTDRDRIKEKMAELRDERETLKSDLDTIKDAIQAASKLTSGETPSGEENECLSDLKDNYPAFFDSEGEEEGASLLNKIMGVKRYLTKELKSNKKSIIRIGKQKSDDVIGESSNTSLIEKGESSNTSLTDKSESSNTSLIEKGKSSKRKAEYSDSEDSSSSKKNRSSIDEFLEDLPYNPFDDIGTD